MKVAIDPGHGQDNLHFGVYDGGAAAFHVEEADVCLTVALTLKFIFEEEGIPCWLTRQTRGQSAPLSQRVGRAVSAHCTRWISVHMNSYDGTASGTESYYRDQADNEWASLCQASAQKGFKLPDRGLKREMDSQHSRLAIFAFPGPASLVEMGFIDNHTDLNSVMTRNNRILFADELVAHLKQIITAGV